MQRIERKDANTYLSKLGLKIGNWNQITSLYDSTDSGLQKYRNFKAPSDSLKLFTFAQHVAGWLPVGEWKIIQFDNSTSLGIAEASFFTSLIFKSDDLPERHLIQQSSFFIDFGLNGPKPIPPPAEK